MPECVPVVLAWHPWLLHAAFKQFEIMFTWTPPPSSYIMLPCSFRAKLFSTIATSNKYLIRHNTHVAHARNKIKIGVIILVLPATW